MDHRDHDRREADPVEGRGGQGREDALADGPRGRFVPRRRVCTFCVEHIKIIDYKDIDKIRRFVSDRAKNRTPSPNRRLCQAPASAPDSNPACPPYRSDSVRGAPFLPQCTPLKVCGIAFRWLWGRQHTPRWHLRVAREAFFASLFQQRMNSGSCQA